MSYRKEIELGKVDYNGSGRKNCPVSIEVEIRDRDNGAELSICGNIWNPIRTDCYSCGQNLDEIAKLVPTAKVRRIHAVWKEWHLNGMNAGTPAQTAIVKTARPGFAPYPASDYDQCLRALEIAGLLYDPDEDRDNGEGKPRGYRYGSEWLYRPLPADVIAEVESW